MEERLLGGTTKISKSNHHILDVLPNLIVLAFKQNLVVGTALKDCVVLSEGLNEFSLFRPFALSCFSDSNCIIQLWLLGLVEKQSDRGIQILSHISL